MTSDTLKIYVRIRKKQTLDLKRENLKIRTKNNKNK